MNNFHTPVLLKEVIQELNVRNKGKYIDATIGGGGHTEQILHLGGQVLGIDQDEQAILHLKKKFESEIERGQVAFVQGNFRDLKSIAQKYNFDEVNGILFDLGVSSFQIDESGRGFSFRRDEPLDMRMSSDIEITAEEIINTWPEEKLAAMFAKYGEEPKADEVAHQIIFRRKQEKFKTSIELAEFISSIIGPSGNIHPATRIFQAIRIVVNDEIGNLKQGLESGFKLLRVGGRMEVISFHSLEDRAVKLYFVTRSREGEGEIITKKVITANFTEIKSNRRAGSAKLRIIQKK